MGGWLPLGKLRPHATVVYSTRSRPLRSRRAWRGFTAGAGRRSSGRRWSTSENSPPTTRRKNTWWGGWGTPRCATCARPSARASWPACAPPPPMWPSPASWARCHCPTGRFRTAARWTAGARYKKKQHNTDNAFATDLFIYFGERMLVDGICTLVIRINTLLLVIIRSLFKKGHWLSTKGLYQAGSAWGLGSSPFGSLTNSFASRLG